MLSDSLDPDQDLQSGSKLLTWYDVCCNIRGGLCPSCKIQRGGLCPSCKIHGGDYVLVVKFMGGILSTYTKMSRGDFVRGGLCPYPCHKRYPFQEKSPAIITCIWHSSIDEATIAQDLYQGMRGSRNFRRGGGGGGG